MVKLVSLSCPKCGANLKVDENLKQCFCQFCGVRILIDKNETVSIYRDEARIKEAETNERIKLKELELKEKREKQKGKRIKALIILLIISVLLFLHPFLLGIKNFNDAPPIVAILFGIGWLIFTILMLIFLKWITS